MKNIKEYLSYDPLTGLFTRIKCMNIHKYKGVTGIKQKSGHIHISYKGKRYYAHRLAWYFTYGEMPECDIDHINEDPSDNRICNLRLITRGQNLQNVSNKYINNTSGFKGVHWNRGKWESSIGVKGKHMYLGRFDTPEEAHAAYLCAKREHHPYWVEEK